MRYTTTDELEHFSFAEAYIADVQVTGGFFHMTLSNVMILPENSCNRDIRCLLYTSDAADDNVRV